MNKKELKTNAINIARNPKTMFVIACVVLIFIIVYLYGRVPTSYLSVDINPSVEMGVNTFGKIVNVKFYNEDGKKLISKKDVTGKTVQKAVNVIVSKAILEAYISSSKEATILLTVAMNNDKIANRIIDNASDGVNEVLKKSTYKTRVYKNVVAMSYYFDASKMGMSIGRYNLFKKAKTQNPAIESSTFKNDSIADLIIQLEKENINLDGTPDATSGATTKPASGGDNATGSPTGTSIDATSGATTKPASGSSTTPSTTTVPDATSSATTKPTTGATPSQSVTDSEDDEDENEYEDD